MLDALAALARRPTVIVAAAVLVVVAVVGPALLDGGDDDGTSSSATTAVAGEGTTTVAGTVAASTTISPDVAEVDRPGEPADPSLYAGQRVAGAAPTTSAASTTTTGPSAAPSPPRISGYSAWADAVDAPATDPDGVPGDWVRVKVRVLNRDEGPQPTEYSDWTLVGPDGVALQALRASQDFTDGRALPANAQVVGEVVLAHPAGPALAALPPPARPRTGRLGGGRAPGLTAPARRGARPRAGEAPRARSSRNDR